MNAIYAIVTHHERPDEAADAWKDCGVCAIGWARYGNLKKTNQDALPSDVRSFLEIKKGDLILAYAMENRIAFIGEIVDGKYKYTSGNIVGRSEDDGGFEYPNQYKVNWYPEPCDFSRYDFPPFLSKQLGKKGKTVIKIDFERRSFDKVKEIILTTANSRSLSYEWNEEMVKIGIGKYLKRHLDSLEKGLRITKSEKSISKTDRPDFIAEDANGQMVIIECKGTAYPEDCTQLEQYGKNVAKENPRLMLIAFKIANECMKLAKKSSRIELYECDLEFRKI